MRVRTRGPGVDEEPNGHEGRGENAGEEVVLELAEGAGVELGEDSVLEVEVLDDEGDGAGGEHAEENQARGGGIEAEIGGVDDRQGLGVVSLMLMM